MATLSQLLDKLDVNIQVRGRQFERICKWYLQNDPKYRLQLNRVWLWSEWPGRWGPDAGIDLVAQTHDKAFWAIQAKAYAPTHHITKADLDTFLSESSRRSFSYRLLISTTNFIGGTAERTLHAQEKPVGRILLSDLEKSQLAWPDSPETLEAKPLERKKPLPHQDKAISDVCRGFSEHDRGQLIMACGTGKTLVALWVAERLRSQRTLILVPSLSLLAQTLREWSASAAQVFRYLPVCSDDTVRGEDRLISKTSDLGLPVTTNSDEVAHFLRQRNRCVIFTTYQSSPVIARALMKKNLPAFDLAIADEAHRCAGPAGGDFATILQAGAIKATRRLFMTATPRYFTDRVRKEAKVVDFEIASMDDERKFGPVFHRLSFSKAIEQDLLSDYQVVIVGVDDPAYREYAENGAFVTFDGKNSGDARTLASHIAVAKAMRKYDLRRVISFHNRVKRAQDFSSELPDVIRWMASDLRPDGDVWSKHVSGEMPSGKRDALLGRFQHLEDGERGLLANARCLAEGIDLPNLDGLAFIDPRGSQVDIVQAVGRAIRKAPDKKIGTVVLPVFVDSQQDSEAALNSSVFRPVWSVLKALRAHDEVLAEELDRLRRQLGRYGSKDLALPEKLIIDLPVTISPAFADSFRLRLVEESTSSWRFWFGLLEDYVEHQGNVIVPVNYVSRNGYRLGSWVRRQIGDYRKGRLPSDRQYKLANLPGWTWDLKTDTAWNEGFECLLQYVQHIGTAYVPQKYVTEEGYRLGAWINAQRMNYTQGKMSFAHRKALEELPGWQWSPKETAWQKRLKRLQMYVEQTGSALIPSDYLTQDGYRLGRWVVKTRYAYNKGRLSKKFVSALKQLPGWSWDSNESVWEEGFSHLLKYIRREATANVPRAYVTKDGYNLGNWVGLQRYNYRNAKLPKDKQRMLAQLPGWVWDPHEDKWQKGFECLCKHLKCNMNKYPTRKHTTQEGYPLGSWIHSQRGDFRKGKLSLEHQKVLEELPGWVWDPHEAMWEDGFVRLCEFVQNTGHAYVKQGYTTVDGYNLGGWITERRQEYRRGTLSRERQEALVRLPGWTWRSPSKHTWAEAFQCLREYVEIEGHPRVPMSYVAADGQKLARWIFSQRQLYRRGSLSGERRQALEQLPGWTWTPRRSAHNEQKPPPPTVPGQMPSVQNDGFIM